MLCHKFSKTGFRIMSSYLRALILTNHRTKIRRDFFSIDSGPHHHWCRFLIIRQAFWVILGHKEKFFQITYHFDDCAQLQQWKSLIVHSPVKEKTVHAVWFELLKHCSNSIELLFARGGNHALNSFEYERCQSLNFIDHSSDRFHIC